MHPCGAGTLAGIRERQTAQAHSSHLQGRPQRAHNPQPLASQPRASRSCPAPRPAAPRCAQHARAGQAVLIRAGARAWRGWVAAATGRTTPSRAQTCVSCGPRPPCARAWPSRRAGRPTCSCPRSGPGTRRCPRARTSPRTRWRSAGPHACLPRARAGALGARLCWRSGPRRARRGAHTGRSRARGCHTRLKSLAVTNECAHAVRLKQLRFDSGADGGR